MGKCRGCGVQLTPDIKSARSVDQCVECYIDDPAPDRRQLFFLESHITKDADGDFICDDQCDPKAVSPSMCFTSGYVSDVIRVYLDERGGITCVSQATVNNWFADLDKHDFSRLQVGFIPFSLESVDADTETDVTGIYVSLIYGTETNVAIIATDISQEPECEVFI